MIIYLLKFTAILSVLYVFYKVFLEQENMHVFKRFYLISSVLLAFAIPLITFTSYVEIPATTLNTTTLPIVTQNQMEVTNTTTNYLPYVLVGLYCIGVLVLLFKFLFNITSILQKIHTNDKVKDKQYINVLLEKIDSPHTFFKYIFLDKQLFQKNKIPKEVLLHEQTHAKQKHSIDILFIELLQIVFWFHPLVYFLKKSIKLNHEFLADNAVLKNGILTTHYQKLLLSFSTENNSQLANAINYPTIKKRFKLMKTQTSKQTAWLKSLLIIPMLVVLTMVFSTSKVIAQEASPTTEIHEILETLVLTIDKDNQLFFRNKKIALNNLSSEISITLKNLSKKEIEKLKCTIEAKSKTNMSFIQKISKEINKAGIKKITVLTPVFEMDQDNYEEVVEEKTAKIKVKAAIMILKNEEKSKTKKAAKTVLKKTEKPKIDDILKLPLNKDTSGWVYLNNQTLFYQIKDNTLKFYNRWSNEVDKDGKELKNKKSKLQEKPTTGFKEINGTTYFYTIKNGVKTFYDNYGYVVDSKGKRTGTKRTKSNAVVQNQNIAKVYKDSKVVTTFEPKPVSPPAPPSTLKAIGELSITPPPPPTSPLQHVQKMAKKGATFYFNNKKISAKKAIRLVKENQSLNISSKTNNGVSTVHITTNGVNIK